MSEEEEKKDHAREVMNRAIRRLNILEYVILGLTALIAVLGGALVAWLVSSMVEVSFRVSWVVASLLLFVIPGAVVYSREHRLARKFEERRETQQSTRDADG